MLISQGRKRRKKTWGLIKVTFYSKLSDKPTLEVKIVSYLWV